MSLSLDDKLLGEKVHNYCSSDEEGSNDEDTELATVQQQPESQNLSFRNYPGYSTNTGPKGVINDWREYKKLENERRVEADTERLELAKKLSITCNSYLNEDDEKGNGDSFNVDDIDVDEAFLAEYRRKRLEQMKTAIQTLPTYGQVHCLHRRNYVDSIDKESPNVTILVHVYNQDVPACESMSGCFKCLAKEYPTVKFCEISAVDANLSTKFSFSGVPAILAYRNKQLIGNFVGLSQEFGEDFFAVDLESYLHEHGVLPFNDQKHTAIRDQTIDEIDDSDFEVD